MAFRFIKKGGNQFLSLKNYKKSLLLILWGYYSFLKIISIFIFYEK